MCKERALSERLLDEAGAKRYLNGRAGSARKKSMRHTRGGSKAAGTAGRRRTAPRKRRALRCASCVARLRFMAAVCGHAVSHAVSGGEKRTIER